VEKDYVHIKAFNRYTIILFSLWP